MREIEINAAGYLKGLRKAFDGVTYFGSSEDPILVFFINNSKKENDYVMSVEESGFSAKQFKIAYSLKEDKYYIQDLGHDSGTFIKIDKRLEIKQGYIITFGKYHIIMDYQTELNSRETMGLQIIDGIKPKQK
eukprot:TRINITY_DN7798_c0_g1_i1.p1 TRINITY_DN7798_c0_g1~~TRINITY_DN7798_c0_g1_i1.p1  ORF type:complete len:133 (-),score=14.08 TRINITY_DN7798_c0_g1_i1:346-744(-)